MIVTFQSRRINNNDSNENQQLLENNTMKKICERALKRLIHTIPLYVEEQISRNLLLELISKLHPINPGIELVRLGAKNDGGYLVPDDFEGIKYCFSPGVANISSFETDLVKKGIHCFLADHSVPSPKSKIEGLTFTKKHIGSFNNDQYMTMENWVNDTIANQQEDLVLQMDVEGGEYEIFFNIPDTLLQRFRILVVEFHYLNKLFDLHYFTIARRVFEKILIYFDVVHLHPNNFTLPDIRNGISIPPLMEFTFLRKDRFLSREYFSNFPNKLDMDNCDRQSVKLPKEWYRSA